MELIINKKIYNNVKMSHFQRYLNIYLHYIHREDSELSIQQFQYESFYFSLYSHCIRHDKVDFHENESITISNEYDKKNLNITMEKKKYVKICVSMVNIFKCIVLDGWSNPCVIMPKQLIQLWKVPLKSERHSYSDKKIKERLSEIHESFKKREPIVTEFKKKTKWLKSERHSYSDKKIKERLSEIHESFKKREPIVTEFKKKTKGSRFWWGISSRCK